MREDGLRTLSVLVRGLPLAVLPLVYAAKRPVFPAHFLAAGSYPHMPGTQVFRWKIQRSTFRNARIAAFRRVALEQRSNPA